MRNFWRQVAAAWRAGSESPGELAADLAGVASCGRFEGVEIFAGDAGVAFEEAVERFEAFAGFFDGGFVEEDRAAVVGAQQEEADAFAALAFDEVGQAAGAFGAAHFAADGVGGRGAAGVKRRSPSRSVRPPILAARGAGAEQAVVGPVADHRLGVAAFALGDFVFVVREHEVEAAAVDVERFAEQLLAHGRAFDVPAGPAVAPGAVPRRLARLGRFPEGEVGHVPLAFAAWRRLRLACDSIERLESLP